MQITTVIRILLLVVSQIAFFANVIHFIIRRKEKGVNLWYFKQAGVARYILSAWYFSLFASWVLSLFHVIDIRYFELIFLCFFTYLNVYSTSLRAHAVTSQINIDVDESRYLKILELYKVGKVDEAKRFARSNLSSPSEFRRAGRLIKEYDKGIRGQPEERGVGPENKE